MNKDSQIEASTKKIIDISQRWGKTTHMYCGEGCGARGADEQFIKELSTLLNTEVEKELSEKLPFKTEDGYLYMTKCDDGDGQLDGGGWKVWYGHQVGDHSHDKVFQARYLKDAMQQQLDSLPKSEKDSK